MKRALIKLSSRHNVPEEQGISFPWFVLRTRKRGASQSVCECHSHSLRLLRLLYLDSCVTFCVVDIFQSLEPILSLELEDSLPTLLHRGEVEQDRADLQTRITTIYILFAYNCILTFVS